jgi:hypothetical protein
VSGTFNPFATPRKQKIVYNVIPTGQGWQVQALVPDRISVDDRIKVIDWFHAYRSTVRKQYPCWLTTFHSAKQGYYLDILRTDSPRDMNAHTVDNAFSSSQQTEFDFEHAER